MYFFIAIDIKEISNLALCATSGQSPTQDKNLFVTSSSVSESLTISSVIQVSSDIWSGIWYPGLINSSNLSIISPSFNLTAPISIIWSPPAALNPVVSVSNTTYVVPSSGKSFGLTTTYTVSSTSVNSVPYNPLKWSFTFSIFLLWARINWYEIGKAWHPLWSVIATPL